METTEGANDLPEKAAHSLRGFLCKGGHILRGFLQEVRDGGEQTYSARLSPCYDVNCEEYYGVQTYPPEREKS